MNSGIGSMVSLHQDQRTSSRYNSNSNNIANKNLPWDLESSFQALKEKFRNTKQKIYTNFPPHREEVENISHSIVLDIKPPKSAKPTRRRHRRTSSITMIGSDESNRAYSSEYGAQAAFRGMKKVVQDRNKEYIIIKTVLMH